MASNDFSLSSSSDSEVSEMEDYELEVEGSPNSSYVASDEEGTQEAYADDPLADEEWLALYERDRKEEEALEKTLQNRLNGTENVRNWCQCGNCDLHFLQNISECYCCCELEGCVEALTSDLVLQDLPDDAKLSCIIHHPGFNPVCLQKWSLRLASHKYRTKGKKKIWPDRIRGKFQKPSSAIKPLQGTKGHSVLLHLIFTHYIFSHLM